MAKKAINLSLSDMELKRASGSFAGGALLPTRQEDLSGVISWRLRNGNFCLFREQRTNSPHLHKEGFEICLVLEGSGKYLHGGCEHPLRKGDLFLADPGVVHEISSQETGDLLLAFFVVFADKAPERPLPGEARREEGVLRRFLEGHAVLTGGCEDLSGYVKLLSREGVSSSEGGSYGTDMVWRAFAFECLDRLSSKKARVEAESKAPPPTLEKALDFIRANSGRSIGTEDAAKAAGVSGRQLRRIFKEELGCGIHERIAEARIQRSLHLLAMRFPVCEVARAIGESSQAQFCRLFKRRTGMTPKEFQSKHAPRRAGEQLTRPQRLKPL